MRFIKSAFDLGAQMSWEPVGQFKVLDTFGMTTTAISDDHIHIMS
jgi:hypothetical protein